MRKVLVPVLFVAAASAAAVLMLSSMGPGATAQAPEGEQLVPAAAPGVPIQQPINFSHKIHAGDVGLDCLYCHVGADDGAVATIPAVETCMGCHKMVGLGRPEIDKLAGYWERQEPIPWIKVNDLVDHARFDHHRHVAADVQCQTCHGPVETMDQVYLQQDLLMGFCVQCHKQNLNTPNTPTSLDCATCHR